MIIQSPLFFIDAILEWYIEMVDPTIISDPSISAISINFISSLIIAGIKKATGKIFRQEDVVDYLESIPLRESLEQEFQFGEISEDDIRDLENFLKFNEVIDILSQIYQYSDESISQIEEDFIRLFCKTKPIGEQSTEIFGKRIFFGIRQAFNETALWAISQGKLPAHEYKSQERHKETLKRFDKLENAINGAVAPRDSISSTVPKEYVDSELEESVELIKTNEVEQAKIKLISILGFLDKNPSSNKKLLSRTYHLLAIAYNKSIKFGGDFDTAERYANLSLTHDPLNNKVKGTLASIYFNKGGKENQKKSFSIATRLWEQSDENDADGNDALFLEVYLWGLCVTKTPDDAIAFFEGSDKAQDLVEQNEILSNVIAWFYLSTNKPRKTLEHINNSIAINPKNPDHYKIKADAYRLISLAEDSIDSDFELLPKLKKADCVEIALRNYQIALSLCNEKTDPILRELIKHEIYLCGSLLLRAAEREFRQVRFLINVSQLSEDAQKSLEFLDFVNELNCRHFSSAADKMFSLKDWQKIPYEVKRKLGIIFLNRGSPEGAKTILKPLETEAELKNDFRFGFIMGDIEALLGNKPGVFRYAKKSKDAAIGSDNEKLAFSYQYSKFRRYRENMKEIDREINSLQEHDKKYPEETLLKEIPFDENAGKPPQEIMDFLSDARERDTNIKRLFTDHQVPSYILANVHKVTYIELMNRIKDPNFFLRHYPPEKIFQQDLEENINAGEVFAFDYSSLLNLSKMELLGEVENIPGKLIITRSLFDKIQFELLSNENEDLRRLWNFIRSSGYISIVDINVDPKKYEEVSEHLEKWAIDLIDFLSAQDNSVLVSDDYNFIRLYKTFHIKSTTTLIFLKYLLKNSLIDSKIYGVALGVLADRMYIILPYDGEDLFHIVLDDQCKIQLRSYHLINHITMPEVRPSVYSNQFVYFIELLWRTGALYDDKRQWLSLITERIINALIQRSDIEQTFEAELVKWDLKIIWHAVISNSKLSELTVLEEECGTLFENESSKDLKEFVFSELERKRNRLSADKISP